MHLAGTIGYEPAEARSQGDFRIFLMQDGGFSVATRPAASTKGCVEWVGAAVRANVWSETGCSDGAWTVTHNEIFTE
jgi:hypothetical protein